MLKGQTKINLVSGNCQGARWFKLLVDLATQELSWGRRIYVVDPKFIGN